MPKLSLCMITLNEQADLKACLDCAKGFVDEIIVVDSYSTDGTYGYLLAHEKVRVIQHPFKNYTAQKAYALEKASNDWIIFVDADEVVTSPLQNEIVNLRRIFS